MCCVFVLFSGPEKGGYYHEMFLRGKLFLTKEIQKIKGKRSSSKGKNNSSASRKAPCFYSLPCWDTNPSISGNHKMRKYGS